MSTFNPPGLRAQPGERKGIFSKPRGQRWSGLAHLRKFSMAESKRGGGGWRRSKEREEVPEGATGAPRSLTQDKKGVRFEFGALPAGCSAGQAEEGLY